MKSPNSIKRIYTRLYTDNKQLTAYVDWADGARTEGRAELYHGVRVPVGAHMGELFDAGLRQGLTVEHETW